MRPGFGDKGARRQQVGKRHSLFRAWFVPKTACAWPDRSAGSGRRPAVGRVCESAYLHSDLLW